MKAPRFPAHALIPAASANVSGNVTPDMSTGHSFMWTLTGDISIQAPTFPPAAGELVLVLIQDATGGRAVTWNAQYTGSIPAIDAAPNAVTVYRFLNMSTTGSPSWYCVSGKRTPPAGWDGQAGTMLPAASGWYPQNVALVAGRQYALRVWMPEAITINHFKVILRVSAGANDVADMGVWSGNLGTKIASLGSTSGKLNAAAESLQDFPLTVTFKANTVYYVVFAYGAAGGAVAQVEHAIWDAQSISRAFGDNAPQARSMFKDNSPTSNAVPLPASGALSGFSAVGLIYAPIIILQS